MIEIKFTETSLEGELLRTGIKTFNSDADSLKFLKDIHDNKMNIACTSAGLGNYTEGKITSPCGISYGQKTRREKPAYYNVQRAIQTKLVITVKHLN